METLRKSRIGESGDIYAQLERLLDFAERRLLLQARDRLVARGRLYLFLHLEGQDPQSDSRSLYSSDNDKNQDIYSLSKAILKWAAAQSLYDEQSVTEADLFLSNLLGQVCPLPSQLEACFWQKYSIAATAATDSFYQISQDSGYIRRDRLAQNFSWQSDSLYGTMEITINLAKPEKDPKAIAAAARQKQSSDYPRCVLCQENEGYPGHMNWAPRFNHRVIELKLNGNDFALQYSPYLYYPEHSILLSREHKPMAIGREAFAELFDFVRQFPHYMVGSNADLPIVGGSILSHHHFQAGRYEFPMFRAAVQPFSRELPWRHLPAGASADILQWPLSCLRLRAKEAEPLAELGTAVLECWRSYSDQANNILAQTEAPHNTITPIVRQHKGLYEFFLVLRNNRCSAEHPLGIYHPHAEIHHIKKENIGLIEVMGLAILPGRLKAEMKLMADYLLASAKSEERQSLEQSAALRQHLPWLRQLSGDEAQSRGTQELQDYLQKKVAEVFVEGLNHCGVLTSDGAWRRFLRHCGLLLK